MTNIITAVIEDSSSIESEDELKDAIWHGKSLLYNNLPGDQITKLAKKLSWDNYEFKQKNENRPTTHAAILEETNNTVLAILGRDGQVYQLGDIVQFETTRSNRGWTTTRSREKVTCENQIDYLSEYSLSISVMPTYSNPPRDSPSVTPGETDISIIQRSDLDEYRERLTEGTNLNIPDSINGWTLEETDQRNRDPEDTILANNIVTKMQWSNGENTYITAVWRGSYHCWRLSTPVEGILTEENVDEYLYEIDVPQQVVRTRDIIELASEAMKKMDGEDFQDPYDLRNSNKVDNPSDIHAGFVPTQLPPQIGDWKLEERSKTTISWQNKNSQSAWNGFSIKIDFHGGVVIKNEPDNEVHDRRLVKKHFPNGEPHPDNIENDSQYAWRRRDMWDDNWFYGIAFMIQTSKEDLEGETEAILQNQAPATVNLHTFNHGFSEDVTETMDRQNDTLLAYT